MRHRKARFKLNRTASHRKATLRNLVTSLLEHERIVTTEAKAKAARGAAEKMITLAKRGDLHARRQALAFLTRKPVTHKLFSELKDRYMDRSGGYTAIVRLGPRLGDSAPLSVLALIKPEERAKPAKKKRTRRKTAGTRKAAAKKEKAAPPEAPAQEAGEQEPTGADRGEGQPG